MIKKGIDSASADFGLFTTAYHLKRMIHIWWRIISRFFTTEFLSKRILRDVHKESVFLQHNYFVKK